MISRVYVIDDDDQFRNSLCALIESVDLEVEGWGNPEDLLKKSSLHRPGCVVLDHRLPLLSGLEVLRIIRKTSSIPAILISAYADVQTAVAAMEMGASRVREIAGGARNPGTKPRRDLMMSALARARLRRACGHARREHRPRAKGRRGTWAGARRVRDKRSKSGLTPSTSEGFPLVPSLFFRLAANVA